MTDALTIADFLLSHAGDISNYLMIGALVIAVSIGLAEHKSKLIEYITNRRNKWWFVYLAVVLAAIIFLRSRSLLAGYWLIIISVLWFLYGLSCVLSLKPKRFMKYTHPVLRRYEKWLYDGSTIEHVDFFRKQH